MPTQTGVRSSCGSALTRGAGGYKEFVIPPRSKNNALKLSPTLYTGGEGPNVVTLKASPNQGPAAVVPTFTARRVPKACYDADEDEVEVLCPQCGLPIGDLGYVDDKDGTRMHGECKAQLLLQSAKKEDELRMKKDALLKKQRRAKYDLGWKIERVPCSLKFASVLGSCPAARGLCALAWQGEAKKMAVVTTTDQATSINLEYLSLALQVRRKEGREPLFSLDPRGSPSCPPNDREALWQVKRFEPAWLAGTSVGEVLFQADYHLKELSMGEHAQPIVGMKSCFELASEDGLLESDWHGREWFVVNKAEIQLSEAGLMIPSVRIGVEAREQVEGPNGMEDKRITWGNHPLVKYADTFTHNFDLIAERKSVVYHLRELAKASVLAKFFVESQANLDESWYTATSTVNGSACLEIPQTWNEHCFTELQVSDGQIVNGDGAKGTPMYGIYGGVEFGLDRLGRVPSVRVSAARAPALSARMISARSAATEFPITAAAGVRPQGVDLDLGRFDLSTPVQLSGKGPAASWTGDEFLGSAFWSKISGSSGGEDMDLLRKVFNPHLCDRRADGDLFVPPDTSLEHVSSLRALVGQEAALQQERTGRFLSTDFEAASCGALFPATWAPSLRVAPGKARASLPGAAATGPLYARPDYEDEAAKLLANTAPAFDRCTEDGMRFRIYKVGSVEIRSTQPHRGEEAVGAAFSTEAPAEAPEPDAAWSTVARTDRIAKAVEYVESSPDGAAGARYYVVLTTEQGDSILTERLADGTVSWEENPAHLEIRSSLAKVVRTTQWTGEKVAVQDMKRHRADEADSTGSSASQTDRKNYAHRTALRVVPAREKAWATFTKQELAAAEQLGVCDGKEWASGAAKVCQLTWQALTDAQREAARALGLGKAHWGRTGRAPILGAAWEKQWSDLTSAEQQAARVLGIDSAGSWVEAPWFELGTESGAVWEKSWAQLTEAERDAAQQLGIDGADAWDEVAWIPGGAWGRKWSQLAEAERRAAGELDVAGADAWDRAFGNPDKRGQELGGVWEKCWAQLTGEARRAAKQLGIAGAGAWDKSNSKASWQKQWARQTEAEQEAAMERWFQQNFQGVAGNFRSP